MFYKDKCRPDGLCFNCKLCVREYKKTVKNRPGRRLSRAKKQRAYELRHPERQSARAAVKRAIASGKMVKQPCEKCGLEKAHAHHDDYSKPLDVRWLCHTHHVEVHAGMIPLHLRKENVQANG
jgi:hypothetical protein